MNRHFDADEMVRIAMENARDDWSGQTEAPPEPLQWLDMSQWDASDPPPIDWIIPDRIPRGQVGLFSGIGGTGKTTIDLMRNVAHVIGLPWYNMMPAQGPAIYVGTEDPDNVLRIRLTAIARYFNTTFEELVARGLHILNLFGKDAAIFHYNTRTQRVETTTLYKQIYEAAGDLKPVSISLDPLARIFTGNEIDRTQVYGVVGHGQSLAQVCNGSVTILSHPSLAGINSGSGISGSTAWHDGFRFRQYLKTPKDDDDPATSDLRELSFMKIQYGPPAASITLRYERGLFLPPTGQTNFEDAKADSIFLDILGRMSSEGRNVSHTTSAPNYAPKLFAAEPEAKSARLRKADLENTMRRLFLSKKIVVQQYGKPSNPHDRLVRA
jgi:RecA-family ATPase